ncbi:hypothetical protein AB1Y20_017644 [Prymnesium parvum]|uniref:Uncharacterized protein n=1 Tax=Prymnesium parvum TaxID=97485 RepID=A0AB34JL60_PRYPA
MWSAAQWLRAAVEPAPTTPRWMGTLEQLESVIGGSVVLGGQDAAPAVVPLSTGATPAVKASPSGPLIRLESHRGDGAQGADLDTTVTALRADLTARERHKPPRRGSIRALDVLVSEGGAIAAFPKRMPPDSSRPQQTVTHTTSAAGRRTGAALDDMAGTEKQSSSAEEGDDKWDQDDDGSGTTDDDESNMQMALSVSQSDRASRVEHDSAAGEGGPSLQCDVVSTVSSRNSATFRTGE